MNQFTASNGIIIAELQDPKRWTINPLNRSTQFDPFEMQALREFFRAEEDERLGRWRWPEDPDITVRIAPKHAQYGVHDDTVMIQSDKSGYVGYYTRDRLPEIEEKTGGIVRAGHAYFDAHPEPRPWHDAKPGEVWALTVDGEESAFYPSKSLDRAFTPVAPETGRTAVSMESFEITAGRRIYPEPS